MINDIFFELLQVATLNRERLSHTPTDEEWETLYELCKEHTLLGIGFSALQRLPQEQTPPRRRTGQWMMKAMKLVENNKRIAHECVILKNRFAEFGFDTVILKGQANIPYYNIKCESPSGDGNMLLGLFRTPGDIDVWLRPNANYKGKTSGPVHAVIDMCQGIKKGEYVYYHNLDFPILTKTPVEVHYRPTWLFNPIRNRRLQKWFREFDFNDDKKFRDYAGFRIPGPEFNVIFQLLHIYKHIFEEGIGLRQLLDYYFVLKINASKNSLDSTELLKDFGLTRFAGAVMYVISNVIVGESGSKDWMICPVDEKAGKQLLEEIMIAGNFGKYDERYKWAEVTNGSMEYRGKKYAWARLKHNFIFFDSYPEEVICEPFFRVYHWIWRTFRMWRF